MIKFDLARAIAGDPVQYNQFADDPNILPYTMKGAHYIGVSKDGKTLFYEVRGINAVLNAPVEYFSMKPKTTTWWFRTYINDRGEPLVVARKSITAFPDLSNRLIFPEGGWRWVEEAWSKEIEEIEEF